MSYLGEEGVRAIGSDNRKAFDIILSIIVVSVYFYTISGMNIWFIFCFQFWLIGENEGKQRLFVVEMFAVQILDYDKFAQKINVQKRDLRSGIDRSIQNNEQVHGRYSYFTL